MKPYYRFFECFLALVFCALAVAQSPTATETPADELTATAVEARLADLEARPGVDEATKASAVALYKDAVEELRRANELAKQSIEMRRLADEAPQLLESIRAELAKPPSEPAPEPPAGATLQQLEQALSQATADLQTARQTTAELQAETTKRNERRTALPEQIANTRQRLAAADAAPTGQPREGEPAILADARGVLQRAQLESLRREVEALEMEAASYDARRDLLPARRDRAQRRVAQYEKLVSAWQGLVTAQRQTDAQQASREAQRLRREAARQHPVLKLFADETAARAKARTGATSVAERIDIASRESAEVRTQLTALETQFASIQRRLRASGLNRATGLLLRRQYEALEDQSELRRRVRSTQAELDIAEYEFVELQDQRAEAGDIDGIVQRLLGQIPSEEAVNGPSDLEQVARDLATARRNLLDQLIADATTYFEKLADLNTAQHELLAVSTSHSAFIEERILWVRSIAGDRAPRLDDLHEAVAWLTDPASWRQAAVSMSAYFTKNWLFIAGGIVPLIALWFVGHHCRKRLKQLGDLVARYRTDSFAHTLFALILTMLVAAAPALTLFALGWLLSRPDDQVDVARALGSGMRSAALLFFPLAFLRHLMRKNGLAQAHFQWPTTTQPIRRNLRWFIPVVIPAAILVVALDQGGSEAANASLGRILFTVELVALSIFLHRVLRPKGPVLRRFVEESKGRWVHGLRYVWYPLFLLAPLALVTMSWLGFHYTALRLEARLEESLTLALALVVINGVMLRWLFVARRQVAIDDMNRRRELAAAKSEAERGATSATQTAVQAVDEDKVNLPAMSEQTRQLFRAAIAVTVVVGLLSIWSESLPALRMLDRVQVWPKVQLIDVGATTPDSVEPHANTAPPNGQSAQNGASSVPALSPMLIDSAESSAASGAQILEQPLSITLANLGLSLIVLVATSIAFRNVPGLIEIIVLQRLPLDAGSRYALSTVLRYIIAIIGVLIAFNILGLSWAKVQWLAAALTFGLAFGLQEIFANFISGLIILAERPFRLGDTVTVGSVSGKVTRIRMRATMISDWDRKELVIPNKTFITGEVINWTLSDPVLRVIIPVGVSYESDVVKVESILKNVAQAHTLVLDDPEPTILFNSFGDSTLDFQLRVFIPHIDYLFQIRHEMHMAIIKAFREAGVEIAFPQRDLHIRSAGDLVKLVEKRETQSSAKSGDQDGEAGSG